MTTLQDTYGNVVSLGSAEGSYRVEPYSSKLLVGTDAGGRPSVFVRNANAGRKFALETSKVVVELSREYEFIFEDESRQKEMCHRLSCVSSEDSDIRTFLSVVQAYFDTAKTYDYTSNGLTDFFHSLVRLFKIEPDKDQTRARQGLWAELFVMRTYGGYEIWAPYWHSDPLNNFDFSSSKKRVEVKSTVRAERIHEFSHSQVFSSADEIMISSILLRADDSGMSLQSLIKEARESFKQTSHFFKLERAVRSAGMDDTTEEGPKYSLDYAEENAAWFPAEQIPRFQSPEPSGVSGTKYRSNLSGAEQLDSDELLRFIRSWSEEL